MSFALLGLRLLLTSTAFNQKRGVGFDGYGSIRTYLIFFFGYRAPYMGAFSFSYYERHEEGFANGRWK